MPRGTRRGNYRICDSSGITRSSSPIAEREPRADSPSFAPWLRATMTQKDFDGLPEDDIEALRRFGTSRTALAGATLFRQGEQPRELLIIERGEVELVYETRSDRLVVQLLYAGSSVDQLAILLGVPYQYSAVTLSEATLLSLRLDTIRALEELFPQIAFRWVRLLAHSLDRAHQRLLQMAGKSAIEQVSRILLHESAERNDPTLELTQEELAATLALSRQTVSRAFHDLAREGAIKPGRRRVRLLDLEKLRAHVPR
jgi:CRP/FNR family cyclic AMP-dependent transcriptional regulator